MNIKKKLNIFAYIMCILVTLLVVGAFLNLFEVEPISYIIIGVTGFIIFILALVVSPIYLSYRMKEKKATLTDEEENTIWWSPTYLYRIFLGPIAVINIFGFLITRTLLDVQNASFRDWFFLVVSFIIIISVILIAIGDAKKYLGEKKIYLEENESYNDINHH